MRAQRESWCMSGNSVSVSVFCRHDGSKKMGSENKNTFEFNWKSEFIDQKLQNVLNELVCVIFQIFSRPAHFVQCCKLQVWVPHSTLGDATMSKLFRARQLDANKSLPVFRAEELPDLSEFTTINRQVPQMPTGMEKEEESVSNFAKIINMLISLLCDWFT